MIKSKFDFYDIVKISSTKKHLEIFNGQKGIIGGISQSEEDPTIFAYSVDILDKNNRVVACKFIFEEDLQATGEKANKSKIYTGESVRVRVDPKTGEGYLVDED